MNAHYELLAPLASGGPGVIFRARDARTGQEVAIKRLRHADAAADARLLREAQCQARLRHPNIVSVLEAGVDEQGSYVVMELVHGETLEERIARGTLTTKEFDEFARQTLAGLAAAHEHGVLHLDLKPENLMISRQMGGEIQVKILDFGLACDVHALEEGSGPELHRSLHGSIHFMAPEQFRRAAPDERTDLYALGCVFYHALGGKRPFAGDTTPQVMVAHLYHRLEPLATLRPDLPENLVSWIDRLMSLQPARRPASAAAALREFEELTRTTAG